MTKDALVTWEALSTILVLYSWAASAVLVFFLFLIARFYQLTSGDASDYLGFVLPLALTGVAAVRRAGMGQADIIGDLFWFAGGGALIYLCLSLYYLMTRER